jgi:UME (NUC010) domain
VPGECSPRDVTPETNFLTSKVLIAYAEAYEIHAINSPETIESLFSLVMDLLDVGGEAVRETSIATLGSMGRYGLLSALKTIISLFLCLKGSRMTISLVESSVVFSLSGVRRAVYSKVWPMFRYRHKSLSNSSYSRQPVQLKDLSRRRKKTAYSFLSPYLPEIIRYVTANVCSTPSLLSELGRFLSRDPSELLSFTLTHSLPSLVVTCSKDEIHAIARLVGRPVAALLVDKTADILKTIYLLPDDADMEQGLAFLTQMVAQAVGAKADSVGTQALVNSCIAGLLAELVMVLGDENEKTAKSVGFPLYESGRQPVLNPPNDSPQAKRALAKVEKTVAAGPQQRSKPVPRDLATFLKPHILGIMTHLNEVLQEVQGKRSPAYKRQVIRSIGVLVSEVGTPIIAIAPQVRSFLQSVHAYSQAFLTDHGGNAKCITCLDIY